MASQPCAFAGQDLTNRDASAVLNYGKNLQQAVQLSFPAVRLNNLALAGIAQEAHSSVVAQKMLCQRCRDGHPVLDRTGWQGDLNFGFAEPG